jgi:hypothetical protein
MGLSLSTLEMTARYRHRRRLRDGRSMVSGRDSPN